MPKTKRVQRKIRSILIPNRGEIALRIVRSAQTMGLRAVVAHSEIDSDGLAARQADEAILLGPALASESYLSIERIVEAAKQSGCDAVHPGYGFLSEREPFARAVEEAGLVFIGPSPENIRLMGDKVAARRALEEAGIAVVPGEKESLGDASQLKTLAKRVGFPLLLKAAAGGGGKGIRLVREASELESAFQLASSEAENAFGDSTLFAERYLEKARHVEVQIVGDGKGGARVFPERDCSIQRRHQKLFEETPCPVLDDRQREALLESALMAVQLSRYRGAGTLEYLYDGERAYFLEMNTRLQVEHPVTEMVTGVDLVAEQIAVAEGQSYTGKTLDSVRVGGSGSAVEFRINAEDPLEDFVPSTGKLTRVQYPGGPGLRVESAAFEGLEITPYYDSLIAKIVAQGRDRSEALARLRVACEETVIRGVTTTLPLALALAADRDFLADRHHCQYLESRLSEPTFLSPKPSEALRTALALAAVCIHQGGTAPPVSDSQQSDKRRAPSPWASLGRNFGLRGTSR